MKNICLIYILFTAIVVNAQDIGLFQQHNGRYSYTAIGNTLNQAENNLSQTFCEILPSSSANLTLTPAQTVVAAYLYWAGSGTGDATVNLNGIDLVADNTMNVTYNSLQGELIYFSCFKDVTTQIQTTGTGIYSLSGIDISEDLAANPLFCQNRTNFAGWSILVVYQEDTLPLNQVSIYHGLEIINNNVPVIDVTIDNLNVVDTVGAKIGFLSWEGDNALNISESLLFNGNTLESLPLNPGTNAFNGTNSFSNSTTSYNMDLDVYDIENYITTGDTSATIQLTTGADLIIINNIVTVLNSQLPDATVVADDVLLTCDERDVDVTYTVFNTNSTAILPANTPIAMYVNEVLIGTAQTLSDMPIDGSETNTILLSIPEGIPLNFNLSIIVDDNGIGVGVVQEINENNNESITEVTLLQSPVLPELPVIEACDIGYNTAIFDLTTITLLPELATMQVAYYETYNDALVQDNEIAFPSAYQNLPNTTLIYVGVLDGDCYQVVTLNLNVNNCPPWVPSGFSPNNDGVNDVFEISGLLTIFENFDLKIYNRYGTLVYQGGDALGFWNGVANKGIPNNNSVLPVGTYYYVLHLNDENYPKPLLGWVYMNY